MRILTKVVIRKDVLAGLRVQLELHSESCKNPTSHRVYKEARGAEYNKLEDSQVSRSNSPRASIVIETLIIIREKQGRSRSLPHIEGPNLGTSFLLASLPISATPESRKPYELTSHSTMTIAVTTPRQWAPWGRRRRSPPPSPLYKGGAPSSWRYTSWIYFDESTHIHSLSPMSWDLHLTPTHSS